MVIKSSFLRCGCGSAVYNANDTHSRQKICAKNKKTYVVILDKSAGLDLQDRSVESIYAVNDLFKPAYEASSHFSQSNGKK